ncbi:MAG: hypothetical protein MZV64_50235 [Ignavibacteriales bacterium]|nr:hypothetical protein [Ignavibacteriales bacterium]
MSRFGELSVKNPSRPGASRRRGCQAGRHGLYWCHREIRRIAHETHIPVGLDPAAGPGSHRRRLRHERRQRARAGTHRQFPRRRRDPGGRDGHPAVGHRRGGPGRGHRLRSVARRRHDRAHGRRRGTLDPAGRGLHRQRVFGLQRTGLRPVGPLRPQSRGHQRLGLAQRHQGRMGRRRGEPGPGDGRLRQLELVQRDHRLGLFPGGSDRRRDAALHAGPGRRPGGLGDRPAPQLRRHRQHLRRRYRRQPRPRHLRGRHLFQRPRPPGHRRQRQPGARRRGRGRRHLFRRRGR